MGDGNVALLKLRVLLSFGLLLAMALPALPASGKPLTEAQVKAGYLYNFALFVDWPPAAFDARTLVIGVIGDADFRGALDQMNGRVANGRTIAVRVIDAEDDIAGIAMLFVAEPDDRVAASVLARVGRSPILTVGESARFTKLGGVIRLYKEDGKLRFEVNVSRAEGSGLRISSRMLGLARITRQDS